MPTATVAAIQMNLHPGDKAENLRRAKNWITQAAEGSADLACLPEYFNRGYDTARLREWAEPIPGPTADTLAEAARTSGIHVVASFPERGQGDAIHDSAAVFAPDGSLPAVYRKNHLYDTENDHFTPGTDPCVLDLPFGKVAVCICFDFCFDEYMSRLRGAGATLLLHPTAWFYEEFPGQYRKFCANIPARHDMAFLSANVIGPLNDSIAGIGQSCILRRDGSVAAEARDEPALLTAELDFDA